MNYLCFNGNIMPAGQPVLQADNRSYRYGDGLFETMKLVQGNICLETYHWDRLFAGLQLLEFDIPGSFSPESLRAAILHLCGENKCLQLARVRLSVFRGNGGWNEPDNTVHYLVECQPLDEAVNRWNDKGLVTAIYPHARKSCDRYAGLKSANYLPYTMAARYARQQRLDECLVLNSHDRVADGTIANIFLVKNGSLLTPPVSEGCIKGTMRQYLLDTLQRSAYPIHETLITPAEVEAADELFLTNAIYGIRSVKQFNGKSYRNELTQTIHQEFLKTIGA